MAINIKQTNDIENHGVKIICHGQAGAGKTRMISTIKDLDRTIIISAEAGLLSLKDFDINYIDVRNKDDVGDAYRWITESQEAKDIKWVCLDSLSEIGEVVLLAEKESQRDARKAYGEMADVMSKMIKSFRNLKGRHVYMTCKTEPIEGIIKSTPGMPGQKLGNNIPYWFDEVFCLKVAKDKETGETKRWLICQKDGDHLAKDRSGALEETEAPNLEYLKNKILGVNNG